MASELINLDRMLALRAAAAVAHLQPHDEILPWSPAVLLPALRAPLLEVPHVLGALLEPCLSAANSADAPLAVSFDAEEGRRHEGPRGFHGAVEVIFNAARASGFRRPLVLLARLGMVDAEDEPSVDVARIRVLEAVDAGMTAVQLGIFGDVEAAAPMLREMLTPAADHGLGIVVALADSFQVEALPAALAPLCVDAWAVGAQAPLSVRRDVLAVKPAAPFPAWADATAPLLRTLRAGLREVPEAASLGVEELLGRIPDAARPRLEARLYGEMEELLETVRARGSAGSAMVRLSEVQESWPVDG